MIPVELTENADFNKWIFAYVQIRCLLSYRFSKITETITFNNFVAQQFQNNPEMEVMNNKCEHVFKTCGYDYKHLS